MKLSKTFRFEAAHFLPTFPEGHRCRRMHGHSFRIDVIVEGDVDADTGYLIDYGVISDLCEPIRKRLDHYLLNEIEGLENPTAENLSGWVWVRLAPEIERLTGRAESEGRPKIGLSEIVVHETCTSACHYRGK